MAVSLPTLDAIRIASPCNVSWESMTGDERARFCQHCRHQVFNLSAMNRGEAASLFLANRERICVRYYQRPDGTVMFSDCVSEARRRLWQRLALLVGLPFVFLSTLLSWGWAKSESIRANPTGASIGYKTSMGIPAVMGEAPLPQPPPVMQPLANP